MIGLAGGDGRAAGAAAGPARLRRRRAGRHPARAGAGRARPVGPTAARPTAAGPVVSALGRAADPDLALLALSRMATPTADLLAALRPAGRCCRRLVAVLGASAALGDHLAANPADWRCCATEGPRDRAAGGPRSGWSAPTPPTRRPAAAAAGPRHRRGRGRRAAAGLPAAPARAGRPGPGRRDRRRRGRRDAGRSGRPHAVGRPRGRAGRAAAGAAGPAGRDRDGQVRRPGAQLRLRRRRGLRRRAATWRMATRLASDMGSRVCGQVAWPVDAALRPEGKLGPLVRTLASHQAYYARWARTWEFQALLKARPAAGDLALGAAYVETLAPLVWTAAERDDFVADVQAMRRRVEDTLPPDVAAREIKLGRAGCATSSSPSSCCSWCTGGRTSRCGSAARSRRSRRCPPAGTSGAPTARRSPPRTTCCVGGAPAAAAAAAPHPPGARPTTRAALAGPGDGLPAGRPRRRGRGVRTRSGRCTPARYAGCTRSCSTGRCCTRWPGCRASSCGCPRSRRPAGWRRSASPTRTARCGTCPRSPAGCPGARSIQRTLLPVVLNELADAPDPDAGLLAYRQVPRRSATRRGTCGSCGTRARWPSGWRSCSAPAGTWPSCSAGRPEALRMLGDDAELRPRPAEALRTSFRAAAARTTTRPRRSRRRPGAAPAGAAADRRRRRARAARRRPRSARRCTDVVAATVEAALDVARGPYGRGPRRRAARVAVIAMGRVGGAETGYGSDVDVLFVHDPLPGAGEQEAAAAANAVVAELRRLLALPAPDPPLQVDAALRPEGRSGPLVRTLASYQAYYRRWSSPWEAQALLRAAPLAGDPAAGRGVRRAGRPAALPGRRADAGRDHRDPPAQGADGRRAAAPRRRPGHAHQARPRRAGRRRVDGAAAAAAARRAGAGAAHHPDAAGAGRRPGRRPARRRRHRGAGGGVADRDPGPQRGRAGARPARTSCPGGARTWPG